MPELDGRETLQALQADAELATIPVIIVTASGDPLEDLLDAGAVSVMRKPINLDRLLSTIDKHRRRR